MAPRDAEYELVPPDGGWGWMVVLGVALSNMTNQCLNTIFGMLFGDKLLSLGLETTSTAVIMNSMQAVMQFSGLLTGPLLKKFSIRQMSIIGSLFTAGGMFLTSFANSFTHIIITYSLLIGLGSGLVEPSGFLAVKNYFLKKRGSAVGMSTAGGNVSLMVMPYLVWVLLETYGFGGAMLIMSGVSAHGLVGSLLFHPLEWHAVRRPVASELEPLKGEAQGGALRPPAEVGRPQEKRSRQDASNPSLATCELSSTNGAAPSHLGTEKRPLWRRAMAFLDLDLLWSGVYLNVIVGTAAMVSGTINYGMLLPFYLQRHVGLTLSDTALVLTMRAVGDCVARFGVNYFTDRFHVRPRVTFLVGSVLSSLCRSAVAMSSGLVALCVCSGLCGFFRGAAVVNINLCVAEVCPEHKLPGGVGLNMVICGIMLLAVGPVIGYVRDETGDYPLCIHLLTGLVAFCMLMWLAEGIWRWYRQKK
ncbi:monocarboxylate transporter 1-like [Schistocerca gregaria]|uniref:monocarboxylate transporter 1-like n=1 Tax=Schistocerca gregaria TaxID=7010 RepID=UPI00211F3693|nr:monocarboxylate transporter 1-like [Schistocerca gregaria]